VEIESTCASNPDSLLGKTDYPHVGRNIYPQTALSVTGVGSSGDACIGVTLRQTVARDELGENLLYNQVKKDELFGVLPGEAVPVLSKGRYYAVANAALAVGDEIAYDPATGKVGAVVGATTTLSFGVAKTSAGADGDLLIVEVKFYSGSMMQCVSDNTEVL